MEKTLSIVVFIILVLLLIIFFIKIKKSKIYILPLIFVFIYFVYSFFFVTGSVRLSILLMGHPYRAYTTDFIESRHENHNYYLASDPSSDLKVTSGSMGFFECKTYGIIKISSYYGF